MKKIVLIAFAVLITHSLATFARDVMESRSTCTGPDCVVSE